MTVSPHLLTFQKGDTVQTMSLSHSCGCPITWTILPLDSTATWLQVTTTRIGDIPKDSVFVDRALLTSDTMRTALKISTNSYHTQSGNTYDTVQIVVFR